MRHLVVDRKRWLRGEGDVESFLLRDEDGKMCCLGFLALDLGYTEDEINSKSSPFCLMQTVGAFHFPQSFMSVHPDGSPRTNSALCTSLMVTNDEITITDVEREAKLTELFKQVDIEVTFTN